MFTLDEVIIIVLIFGAIIGFITYQYAQYRLIARMLESLSDEEIDRLERLKDQLDAALSDEEADRIIESANKQLSSVTLTQEIVGNTLYLYNGNTFVAQGNTATEAAINFFNSDHSCPQATVRCGEGKQYLIIEGKIERLP